MRPLPEELLADIRWTLDHVIRPELEDGSYAAEQAQLMSNLLEHLRLRVAAEFDLLVEDCADIRRTLGRGRLPGELRRELDLVTDRADAVGLETLRRDNDRLRRVLQAAVGRLEQRADQGDQEADAFLAEIRSLLRRQLDRERRIIGPGYALGT